MTASIHLSAQVSSVNFHMHSIIHLFDLHRESITDGVMEVVFICLYYFSYLLRLLFSKNAGSRHSGSKIVKVNENGKVFDLRTNTNPGYCFVTWQKENKNLLNDAPPPPPRMS